ncbi:MAG: beta-N-acetylhexosaminidase [Desulfobacteraceae bacterium]|nr:MAG: beta-N-acetylhexosaminidase [Desulfobacteraceae bacterium]
MGNEFSADQMTGQRLMVGFDGTEFNTDLEFLIGTLKVGGIILFARNIENPNQLARLCTAIQDHARYAGQPPVFIAIDQEGGTVARLRQPHFREFPGIPALTTPSEAKTFALEMAGQLSELGINMNMAPVLDIAPKGMQSIMERRSFGHDPIHVAAMGKAMIESFQEQGIMAVAKHFPGIGRTTLDSHLDMPELDVSADGLEAFDLIPFQASLTADVAGMMLSHIYYKQIDPLWPASLSKAIASDLLRRRLGFDGIVMTDDLDMGAIVNHYDIYTVIEQILAAEIDIALICHKGPNIEIAFEEIKRKTTNDEGFAQKNRESVARILRLKEKFNLAG